MFFTTGLENIFAPSLQPLLVFLFASGVSFAGSLQVGLVNVSVIKAVLVRSRKAALWMALGGCLPELFCTSLAIVAGGFVIRHPQVAELLDYALAAVFLGVGIVALLRKPHAPQNSILRAGQTRGVFWQGLALAMINPQLLPFWFGVYVLCPTHAFPARQHGLAVMLCVRYCLRRVAAAVRAGAHRENILLWLQRYNSGSVLGWVFIVLALWKSLALAL